MDFQDKWRSLLGETIEFITGLQVETGVLIRVGDSTATIRQEGTYSCFSVRTASIPYLACSASSFRFNTRMSR